MKLNPYESYACIWTTRARSACMLMIHIARANGVDASACFRSPPSCVLFLGSPRKMRRGNLKKAELNRRCRENCSRLKLRIDATQYGAWWRSKHAWLFSRWRKTDGKATKSILDAPQKWATQWVETLWVFVIIAWIQRLDPFRASFAPQTCCNGSIITSERSKEAQLTRQWISRHPPYGTYRGRVLLLPAASSFVVDQAVGTEASASRW